MKKSMIPCLLAMLVTVPALAEKPDWSGKGEPEYKQMKESEKKHREHVKEQDKQARERIKEEDKQKKELRKQHEEAEREARKDHEEAGREANKDHKESRKESVENRESDAFEKAGPEEDATRKGWWQFWTAE